MKDKNGFSRRNFIRQTSLGIGAGIVGAALPSCSSGIQNSSGKIPREVTVAGIDLRGLWPDTIRESRINRILERMELVAGIRPDLICLPELFDTIWVSEQYKISEVAEGEEIPGPVAKRIGEFARLNLISEGSFKSKFLIMKIKPCLILACVMLSFLPWSIPNLNGQVKTAEIDALVNLQPEAENLDVFRQWVKWNNPGDMLLDLLTKEAGKLYDRCSLEVAGIGTEAEWKKRQSFVKNKLAELIGHFPVKTPLNPGVTGIIKKDGYRIEKIVFESFPGSYVAGCLYLPEKIRGKVPAVLHVMGHNQESFRADLYQTISYTS